ncbi:hypothetical protein FRB99_003891 [Tulasnella sp. 403]|nr:hypothetical protein FRB99_003891 [Tulasnella sp. 403]
MAISKDSRARIIYGGVVHALSLTKLEILERGLIAVGADGKIAWVEGDVEGSRLQEVVSSHGWTLDGVEFVELKKGEWVMPGFVDTHTHAPQYPNLGVGGQYELLDWLNNVTFPTEAKFSDVAFAKKTYEEVVQRVLSNGTTTCCYYGSLHLEATKVLADIAFAKGQRAFIGKCNMDRNGGTNYQEPSAEQSLKDTTEFIAHVSSLQPDATEPLVQPILTPRFAIACTGDLLGGLGKIAAANPTMAIQTHISENAGEIAFTKQLFPECESYAHVYDRYGLLREKTILAHGCHLEHKELELIKSKGAGISHCPTSNFNLRSGMAKVGEMLDRGIKVGLGTDVSGGYSASMITAIQHASVCSKMVSVQAPVGWGSGRFANKQLPISTLVYLATMGGAELCGLENHIGNFLVGKEFDALLVNGLVGEVWRDDKLEALVEKFLFCGDSRNISAVWVGNRVVN